MLHNIIKISIIAMLALFIYAGFTSISEVEGAFYILPVTPI